jgi:amidase
MTQAMRRAEGQSSPQANTGSMAKTAPATAVPFQLEEATIDEMHAAIRAGAITVVQIVQHYIARARAFNGVASKLVTEDGKPIAPARGTVRAGAPIEFPTETVKVSDVFPDYDRYKGKPLEFGRMEPTASDPDVDQQYGMIVGIENGAGLNCLSTLNIRGERSVVCKGEYDKHPSLGPLPPDAPPFCEIFRQHPDALETAAALDETWGTNPDLDAMPLYGVCFSFKDPFDTKDMRSTGAGDARYDMDAPARDHQLVDRLRRKGAIILAKAINTEYNGRGGDPGGQHNPDKVLPSTLGYQRSSWGGNPANVYDTTRSASLGSSSGSAVSVSANLCMASLGEETRASCRGPSNHNSVALILPHKAMIGFDGGAIGADIYCDRTGIHARNIIDCAKILDALAGPDESTYDPRDPYTTVPRSSILSTGFHKATTRTGDAGTLAGMRLGVIRESMALTVKMVEPIVHAADREIKTILGQHLGATLVESAAPGWTPGAEMEAMSVNFTTALCRLIPIFMPEILFRLNDQGEPVFADFAAAIVPTEFMPGKVFGSGQLAPIDYCIKLAEGLIPPPRNLNIATIQHQELAMAFRFHIPQYLVRRAADWAALGCQETLVDFPTLNARSKFWGDDQRSAFKNWEEVVDLRNPLDQRQGVNERIMLRELLRRVDMMVLLENNLDCFVRLHTPLQPGKIGGAPEPGQRHNIRAESFYGPNAGLTEILIPAGYVQSVYDPVFALSEDGTNYISVYSDKPTVPPAPGLPFSLVFRSEPGKEDIILKVSSAYEAASKRRVPPPRFGPIPMA